MAPAEEFDATLPTPAAVMDSYELNKEIAGRRIADNLRYYYAGLRNLSNQIAKHSEQMRRGNLEQFMARCRGESLRVRAAPSFEASDCGGTEGVSCDAFRRYPHLLMT